MRVCLGWPAQGKFVASSLVSAAAMTAMLNGVVAEASTPRAKKAIRAALRERVAANPRVISDRWFVRQASHVDFTLPVTIRVNPLNDAGNAYTTSSTGDSTAYLDLGPSLGARTIGLGGQLRAEIKFNDAFDGGPLGEVRIQIPPQSGLNSATGQPAGITTTSVPLLTASGAEAECSNVSGFGALNAFVAAADNSAGADDPHKLAPSDLPDNRLDPYAPTKLESNVGAGPYSPNAQGGDSPGDTVLRTGSLALGVPDASTSGGYANLFGLGVEGTPHSVILGVTLTTPINSVVRFLDRDAQTASLSGALSCRQAWTGYINNNVSAYLEGSLTINPGLSADGRLRIATVQLSTPAGRGTHVSLAACLVPFAPFTGAFSGDANTVNPPPSPASDIIAAYRAAGASPTSSDECNSAGPLNTEGFVKQVPDALGQIETYSDFSDVMDPLTGRGSTGAAVAVSGDLYVVHLFSEVLIDTPPPSPETTEPVNPPAVLGVRIARGRARLMVPSGCARRPFNARVRGVRIAAVEFRLDGRVLKRSGSTTSSGASARIDPTMIGLGTRRLLARVAFKPETSPKAMTLRTTVSRCAGTVLKPHFTG